MSLETRGVLPALVLYKLALLALVLLGPQLMPHSLHTELWANLHELNFGAPPTALPGLQERLAFWDPEHYLRIAEVGYQPGHHEQAFRPSGLSSSVPWPPEGRS